MPKSPSGTRPSRRPRARAGVPSNGAVSPATENLVRSPDAQDERVAAEPVASSRLSEPEPASGDSAGAGMVIELPARPRKAARRKYKPPADPRFRIFIIDSGWNAVARRVLRHNFALIRRLHKEELIYLLSRKKSVEFIGRHRSLIGRIRSSQCMICRRWAGVGPRPFTGFTCTSVSCVPRDKRSWRCKPSPTLWAPTVTREISKSTYAPGFAARVCWARSRSSYIRCRAPSVCDREAGEQACWTGSGRPSP